MCIGKQVSGSSSPGSFATILRSPSRQSWEPGLYRAAGRNNVDRPDKTDLCGERRGKEREREGRLLVETGSSREAERDFGVPLDLRRRSGCLERRGEALCVLTCTWIWVHSAYALMCRWATSITSAAGLPPETPRK